MRTRSGDFAQTDEALRLRCVGEQMVVTYKGPKLDAVTKTRTEIELPFGKGRQDFDEAIRFFRALGFQPVGQVAKTRTPYRQSGGQWGEVEVEIALDEVDHLGAFVEIEVPAEPADASEAKTTVAKIAEQLNLSQSERRGYLEMLLERE